MERERGGGCLEADALRLRPLPANVHKIEERGTPESHSAYLPSYLLEKHVKRDLGYVKLQDYNDPLHLAVQCRQTLAPCKFLCSY